MASADLLRHALVADGFNNFGVGLSRCVPLQRQFTASYFERVLTSDSISPLFQPSVRKVATTILVKSDSMKFNHIVQKEK
jgi:hypothetical protein